MPGPDVNATVHELFGQSGGDETILQYVAAILEDEHFEYGDDGELAYEALGPFLVGSLIGWA